MYVHLLVQINNKNWELLNVSTGLNFARKCAWRRFEWTDTFDILQRCVWLHTVTLFWNYFRNNNFLSYFRLFLSYRLIYIQCISSASMQCSYIPFLLHIPSITYPHTPHVNFSNLLSERPNLSSITDITISTLCTWHLQST